jgi:nucleotide-binding universal stress UspA family protein
VRRPPFAASAEKAAVVYHSILVEQNASDASERILKIAMWLASATRAHLTLVHLEGKAALANTRKADAALSDVLDQRAQLCAEANLVCDHRTLKGWSTQTLIGEAKWYDLVVVGKQGAGRTLGAAASGNSLGAVSKSLLASCPVPLLIGDPSAISPSNLLVAFDDSPDACTALRIAAALALERELRLNVVEVTSQKKRNDHLERAQTYIDDCPGLEANLERLPGTPADSLLSFIRERDIHLTFLPALDRSLFGHKLTNVLALESASSISVPRGQSPAVY